MSETNPVVEREEDVYIEVPQWPKTVGILSIIWACLLLGCTGCSLGSLMFMPQLMPPEMLKDDPPMFKVTPLVAVQMGLGILNVLLLLAAGIFCLRRSITGRYLHLVYAVMALILTGVGIIAQRQAQASMESWMAAHPDHPLAKASGNPGQHFGQTIGFILILAITAAYPVFCLIWFGLVKRTAKSMTGMPSGVEAADGRF